MTSSSVALGSPMGTGLCAQTEEEKGERDEGEEGARSSLDSYSQLTDFPKSRRTVESGGVKCLRCKALLLVFSRVTIPGLKWDKRERIATLWPNTLRMTPNVEFQADFWGSPNSCSRCFQMHNTNWTYHTHCSCIIVQDTTSFVLKMRSRRIIFLCCLVYVYLLHVYNFQKLKR